VPREVVARLNAAIVAALKSPEVAARLDQLGYEPIGDAAEQFAATIRADIAKYAKVIKAAGIRADL
jgi:tripartite-type tricarboxylate transporter receptor subunit TctC